jgi:trk system potassium uptake protein TrkA
VLEHIGADVVVYPEKDMGDKLAFMLTKDNVTEFIEFSGYKLVEIRVPDAWVGKNLIDLDIRRKYGINVIAVTRALDGVADVSPSPTRQFSNGEKVSVIGSDKDIEKLMKTYQTARPKSKKVKVSRK